MFKKIISISILVLSLTATTVFAATTLAATTTPKPATIPCVPSLPCINETTQEKGGQGIRDYILNEFGSNFLRTFLGLVAITSVVFIIVGGMQLHLAVGNEEAATKAKKTLGWAIGGLVISILSVAIVQIISRIPL